MLSKDAIDGIARVTIHRHPHVFAGQAIKDSVGTAAGRLGEGAIFSEAGHKQTSLKEETALVPESFPALIRGQKIAKKAAAAGLFSTEDEDVFKDLPTSVVNLLLRHRWGRSREKFSSDEELSEKLGEVLFALCRFCAKYKVSGEMALLKKLEEFDCRRQGGKTLLNGRRYFLNGGPKSFSPQ
ncbi:MAG: hypothetical protein ACLVIY_00110 [Anaerobutyricum soehngenii]